MMTAVQNASAGSGMACVYRIMKKDENGLPVVGPSSSTLGVRLGIDIDLDAQNNVLVNGKGMSVAPGWRDVNPNCIPKRLRPLLPGAGGSNNTFCFRRGEGPFQRGPFANGVNLEPDSPKHGNVVPAQAVPLATYEADLEATRSDWQIDER